MCSRHNGEEQAGKVGVFGRVQAVAMKKRPVLSMFVCNAATKSPCIYCTTTSSSLEYSELTLLTEDQCPTSAIRLTTFFVSGGGDVVWMRHRHNHLHNHIGRLNSNRPKYSRERAILWSPVSRRHTIFRDAAVTNLVSQQPTDDTGDEISVESSRRTVRFYFRPTVITSPPTVCRRFWSSPLAIYLFVTCKNTIDAELIYDSFPAYCKRPLTNLRLTT